MSVDWSKTCITCQYCCRYVSLEIDAPRTEADFDTIRWYLAHRQINIYLDEDDCWYFLVNTPCENLTPQGCGIYEDRFQICRDYDAACCEMTLGIPGEKVLFRNVEDFDRWLAFRKRQEPAHSRNGTSRNGNGIRGHLRPAGSSRTSHARTNGTRK